MNNNKKRRPNKKGKGKKDFRGQYDAKLKREEREADEKELRTRENDWQWYANSPQLVKDFASFPFGVPVGTTFGNRLGPVYNGKSIPGIMRLGFTPTIGEAKDANSPINIAARNIYSFVRHANSGHSNYDAPDLMIYLMSMDSANVYLEWLKRVVRLTMDYTILNRYYPEAILRAMNLDPEDIQKNQQDLRGFINIYATKLGSMCVPNSMSYTARHMWMCSGLFVDSGAAKAQTYFFDPDSYWTFALKGDPAVGALNSRPSVKAEAKLQKVSDLIDYGNALINPILSNEDMNIMSGDILKAFGSDGVVRLSGVADGEMVLPMYSQEVMSQIENAVVFNMGTVNNQITQNPEVGGGYLVSDPSFKIVVKASADWGAATGQSFVAAVNTGRTSRLLNMHHDNVGPEEVMVATRLTSVPILGTPEFDGSNNTFNVPITFNGYSSEVITSCNAYSFGVNRATGQITLNNVPINSFVIKLGSTTGFTTAAVNEGMTVATTVAQFDWAPGVEMYYYLISGGAVSYNQVPLSTIDTDNYTIISGDELKHLAEVALLSQFSVPQMGKLSEGIR